MAKNDIVELGKATRFTSSFQPVNPGRKKQLMRALAKEAEISMADQVRWWNHCRQITADELKAVTNDTTLPGWQLEIARQQYKSQCGDLKAFNALQDRFYGKPKQTVENDTNLAFSGRPVLKVAEIPEDPETPPAE